MSAPQKFNREMSSSLGVPHFSGALFAGTHCKEGVPKRGHPQGRGHFPNESGGADPRGRLCLSLHVKFSRSAWALDIDGCSDRKGAPRPSSIAMMDISDDELCGHDMPDLLALFRDSGADDMFDEDTRRRLQKKKPRYLG